jgi:hypothetical protein
MLPYSQVQCDWNIRTVVSAGTGIHAGDQLEFRWKGKALAAREMVTKPSSRVAAAPPNGTFEFWQFRPETKLPYAKGSLLLAWGRLRRH